MQIQEADIQKKLLYKFDKKIETLFQSFYALNDSSKHQNTEKMIDETDQSTNKLKHLSKQAIIQEIETLKFLNFKYRTALISAKKDQTSNEQILKKAQEQIIDSKRQVQTLSRELQYSLKCKKNKEQYNQLANSLRSTFQPLSIQNQKLIIITKQIEQMEKKYQKQLAQHQKKQKCLKLALSALKSVIDNEDSEIDINNLTNSNIYQINGSLAIETKAIEAKAIGTKAITNLTNYSNGNGQENTPSRQEGEQLQGEFLQY